MLLDGTECQMLMDTGASKSFMSKLHYFHCKSLHSLPKFASKPQRIQVGNGQFVSVLFVTPIIIDIHGHRFEIYMLVSEIHENVDLIIGIKYILIRRHYKFTGVLFYFFLNRSKPFFPKECIILKLKEQRLIRVGGPFID